MPRVFPNLRYCVAIPFGVHLCCRGNTFCTHFRVERYYNPQNWWDEIASLHGYDPACVCQYCCFLDTQFLVLIAENCSLNTGMVEFTGTNIVGYVGLVFSYVTMLWCGVYRNSTCPMLSCVSPINTNDYEGELHDSWRPCGRTESADCRWHARCKACLFWSCSILQIESLLCAGWVIEDKHLEDMNMPEYITFSVDTLCWKTFGFWKLILIDPPMLFFHVTQLVMSKLKRKR